jgi:hypothetical protein
VKRREILAVSYKNIFLDAIKIVNLKKVKLYILWDILKTQYFEPSIPYFITPNYISFKKKN